jgi:hypothetical protein
MEMVQAMRHDSLNSPEAIAEMIQNDLEAERNEQRNVFVFGSNQAGRHIRGDALEASRMWEAVDGIGEGPQGLAYGIPIKDARARTLPFHAISSAVVRFVAYAKENPDHRFLITRLDYELKGYSVEKIASMFKDAPQNCVFDSQWRHWLPEHGHWN